VGRRSRPVWLPPLQTDAPLEVFPPTQRHRCQPGDAGGFGIQLPRSNVVALGKRDVGQLAKRIRNADPVADRLAEIEQRLAQIAARRVCCAILCAIGLGHTVLKSKVHKVQK
jgi:hypothetical protein